MAAVLTIVVGATFVNLAVGLSNESSLASTSPQGYSHAIPLRLAVLVCVFTLALLAARNWLAPRLDRAKARGPSGLFRSEAAPGAPGQSIANLSTIVAPLVNLAVQLRWATSIESPYSRPRMLARLLWQTWRESWKMLVVPILVAAFLLVGVGAAVGFLFGTDESAVFGAATLFFAPALYGALVFHADQRRASYRFLAEHGARPRYVWLSRHIVWLGALVVLLTAITFGIVSTGLFGIHLHTQELAENRWRQLQSPGITVPELWSFTSRFLAGSALAWLGAIVAYAVGQFFSMLFRSEILAAFISLLLSTLLIAWAGMLFAWELSAWWFLLPIACGFLGATWLRAPDWIADRQSLRAWIVPALAIVIPVALIAIAVPTARLAQLPISSGDVITLLVEHSELLSPGPTPEATKTADLYTEAAAMFGSWTKNDLFERWAKPEYMEPIGAYGMEGVGVSAMGAEATTTNEADPTISTFGIDPSKIPPEEREAFFQATAELEKLKTETQSRAIALLVEASQRPTCFFDMIWSAVPTNDYPGNYVQPSLGWLGAGVDPIYSQLTLLVPIVADSGDTPGARIDHQIAALRMCDHLREGQPTAVAIMILELERNILDGIADWAASDVPSQENRRTLLEKLEAHSQARTNPARAFLADRDLVRDAITGKSPPLVLTDDAAVSVHLAYLANELPWERERSLHAVDLITARNVSKTNDLFLYLFNESGLPVGQIPLFEYTSPEFLSGQIDPWTLTNPEISTSYFAVMEYRARVRAHRFYRAMVDTETARRATLLRIALAMYRADQGDYPAAFSDLAPDYIAELPNDPYSSQAFNYSPRGLDLPLRIDQFTGGESLPPHMPLFWSVGGANARLMQQARHTPAPDDEPEKWSTVYVLDGDRLYWQWYETPLIFPLPK